MFYNNSTCVMFDINISGVKDLPKVAMVTCNFLLEKISELCHNYLLITRKENRSLRFKLFCTLYVVYRCNHFFLFSIRKNIFKIWKLSQYFLCQILNETSSYSFL